MAQISLETVRTAWKARQHWVAAGFLGATVLFLLLMFINWRNQERGIESSRATGLSSDSAWSTQSMWRTRSLLPSWPRNERGRPVGMDYLTALPKHVVGGSMGGAIGGVAGNPPSLHNFSSDASSEITERQIIRTGSLEIIAIDPLQAAEQLRNLATNFSGLW